MSSSSSSSSSITINTSSTGATSISGLASGIDTSSLIKQQILADSGKLNKLNQEKQKAEWKQEAYQSIISDIQTFSDTYFSLTSSSSLIKSSNWQKFSVTSSDTSAVAASASSTATAGTHTVSVSQLATAEVMSVSGSLTKNVQGDSTPDYTSASGESFVLNVDGTKKTVTVQDEDSDSTIDLSDLQTAIDNAVGSGKITVSTDSSTGALVMSAVSDSGVQSISVSAPSSGTSALTALGFGSSAITSNRLSTSDSLSTIASELNTSFSFSSAGELNFSINGVSFTFDEDDTLSKMISTINESSAGVTMAYDSTNDKLTLTASSTGAGNNITVSDTSGTFTSKVFSSTTAGTDAVVTIDGTKMTRSSNTITANGITYTLKSKTQDSSGTATTDTVTVAQDTDAIYSMITTFVDAYNSLISTVNTALDEEYDSDYQPLTDTQKSSMSDTEITAWEKKAKTGLLEDDSLLSSCLSNMRSALISSVSGISSSLASIGITSSSDYSEHGKLEVDETTLKNAVETNLTTVTKLFTQQSTSYSGTISERKLSSSERSTRSKEEGIAWKLYDILQDNISSVTDSAGNEGLLLEYAGISGDSTSSDNSLTDQISDYTKRITKEQERLDAEETRLTSKYNAMEAAISKLNSQISYISALTSSS